MLVPNTLQNKSSWDTDKPTIIINHSDPNWHEAYENWRNGKNPTNSPEWKKGVFLTFTVPSEP